MPNGFQWSTGAVVAAALFAGCSSSQMSRIDSNRALYESWPLDTQQAVLDGRVETGMTPDQVQMSLGRPDQVVSRTAGSTADEVWIYRKGGDDPGTMGMNGPSLTVGGGGLSIGSGGSMGSNMGMGTGTGMGIGGPIISSPVRPTPVEEREIVFENGVVVRADPPL